MKKRKKHDAGFKARVAREAENGARAVSKLAARYGFHPTMILQWKQALLQGTADIFEWGGRRAPEIDEVTVRSLHAKIGDLTVPISLPPLRGLVSLLMHDEPLIPWDEAFRGRRPVSQGAVRAYGLVSYAPLLDEDLRLSE